MKKLMILTSLLASTSILASPVLKCIGQSSVDTLQQEKFAVDVSLRKGVARTIHTFNNGVEARIKVLNKYTSQYKIFIADQDDSIEAYSVSIEGNSSLGLKKDGAEYFIGCAYPQD